MAGFFRDLATRALAPRGNVHPISAAPYSPRAESDLPDAAVWPGATSTTAQAGAPRAATARMPAPDVQEARHDDEDDARVPDREPVTRAVRAGKTELHVEHAADREPRATDPQPANAPAVKSPASASPTPAAARAPRITTPLRPAPVRARAPVAPAALRVESRSDAEQSAPEVHIHIGRIELTAAPAPAPAKKPREAATRKAMSLDEYLQQRSRR